MIRCSSTTELESPSFWKENIYYQVIKLGHILNDSWESIWNNPVSQEIRNLANISDECKDCNQLDLCGGGCPLSFYREEYICPESQAND